MLTATRSPTPGVDIFAFVPTVGAARQQPSQQPPVTGNTGKSGGFAVAFTQQRDATARAERNTTSPEPRVNDGDAQAQPLRDPNATTAQNAAHEHAQDEPNDAQSLPEPAGEEPVVVGAFQPQSDPVAPPQGFVDGGTAQPERNAAMQHHGNSIANEGKEAPVQLHEHRADEAANQVQYEPALRQQRGNEPAIPLQKEQVVTEGQSAPQRSDDRAAAIDPSMVPRPPRQHTAAPSGPLSHVEQHVIQSQIADPHPAIADDSPLARTKVSSKPAVIQKDLPDNLPPAAARAAQVDAAIRLENATNLSPTNAVESPVPPATAAAAATGEHMLRPADLAEQNLRAQPAEDDPVRNSGKIVRGLMTMLNSRGGTMHMRLEPPELGQLRVQMTLARGTVNAQFFVENRQAQQLLEKSLAALRTALEGRGLTVERLNVHMNTPHNNQTMQDEAGHSHGRQQQRHDAGDGRSRGWNGFGAEHADSSEREGGVNFERAMAGFAPATPARNMEVATL